MKKILFILSALLLNYAQTFGQCEFCNIALDKDYIKSNSSTYFQLNILKIVDSEKFKEYKKNSDIDGKISIGPFKFGSSISYEDFNTEREKIFQRYSYNLTIEQAIDELKIITNPIAYPEWNNCLTKCYNNQENISVVYAFVVEEDSNNVIVKVKYKGNATSKDEFSCRIIAENGEILQENTNENGEILQENTNENLKYVPKINFKIKNSGEAGFIIKRTNNNLNTIIKISANNLDIFTKISKYRREQHYKTPLGTKITKERKENALNYPYGTGSSLKESGNKFTPKDNDRIEVTAPENGYYNLEAKGSLRNSEYTSGVDAFIYIFIESDTLKAIASSQIATGLSTPGPGDDSYVSGILSQQNVYLKKGETITLYFGNNGGTGDRSKGIRCAYIGDYISIKLVAY